MSRGFAEEKRAKESDSRIKNLSCNGSHLTPRFTRVFDFENGRYLSISKKAVVFERYCRCAIASCLMKCPCVPRNLSIQTPSSVKWFFDTCEGPGSLRHDIQTKAANHKHKLNMKTKILSILGLLTMVHVSLAGQPTMNGKLKVTTLAPEDVCYTGKPYNKELGTYVFNCRDYDPETARWTTQDPSGFPDGANNQIYAPVPTSRKSIPTALLNISFGQGAQNNPQATPFQDANGGKHSVWMQSVLPSTPGGPQEAVNYIKGLKVNGVNLNAVAGGQYADVNFR